jgi:small nuclear ribonucleoprotein (snRNP)-like protein
MVRTKATFNRFKYRHFVFLDDLGEQQDDAASGPQDEGDREGRARLRRLLQRLIITSFIYQLSGKLFPQAFDTHMNIILADCEDPGPAKPKYYNKKVQVDEKKRILSLVLLRGDNVISISVEGPPQQREYGVQTPRAGTGQHYGVSRGVPPVGVGSIPHNQLMPVGSQG